MLLPILLAASWAAVASATDCVPRMFEGDSVVCVCDSDFCDLPGQISAPELGSNTRITSSKDGLRFAVETSLNEVSAPDGATVVVNLDHTLEYQTIFGFGGAFTDSTGFNIQKLPAEAQDWIMKSYFSPDGIEYSVCRIPIAGSDFSTRPYSYDDVEGDVDLAYFNLTMEDYEYKLPYIRRAIELASRELLLFGSPWAPPAWMKVNGMLNGTGGLLPEMWQPWADYFVRFVQAYEAEGAPIWGLTPQNEPLTGFEDWAWNTCAWSAEDMRDWIKSNLGPTLEAADMGHIKLMVLDHNRDALPWYSQTILEDADANKYVDGTAVHWYDDDNTGPEVLSELNDLFPDKFQLYTESCDGWDAPLDQRVILGDWYRAESYASNIIEDINHWSTGWVDWNMALDTTGGPNWANNFVDSPIIVNEADQEFYKQPMFYAMGHFSKFIEPGGHYISTTVSEGSDRVMAAGFHSGDHTTSTVVILNMGESEESVSVDVGSGLEFVNFAMPGKSIVTILVPTPGV
ncbi:putative glucosylceramidase 3 [Eriocheir sinensis]|uniref:putative glucosylceramidase 3 n=1 Tax=Eriocheir sinensis TaxID=95602 RepID=UPI0021C7CEE4|nr:putative glucosylceramidase 3 [Eriocheir sinensis]